MITFDWGVALLCLLGVYFVFFIAYTIFDLTDPERIAKRKAESDALDAHVRREVRKMERMMRAAPLPKLPNYGHSKKEPEVPSFNAAGRSLVE